MSASPQPLIYTDNPFKRLRLEADLTQQEIAKRCGISRHAVIRNEQGMAVEPLPRLLNYYAENFELTPYELRTQYEAFQASQRADAGRLLGDIQKATNVWLAWEENYKVHPLVYLCNRAPVALNPTSLSKALCLNQSVITYFEGNPVHQKTVPEQLLSALKECGYNDNDLSALVKAYATYRRNVLDAFI